jgi:hypothetical protein
MALTCDPRTALRRRRVCKSPSPPSHRTDGRALPLLPSRLRLRGLPGLVARADGRVHRSRAHRGRLRLHRTAPAKPAPATVHRGVAYARAPIGPGRAHVQRQSTNPKEGNQHGQRADAQGPRRVAPPSRRALTDQGLRDASDGGYGWARRSRSRARSRPATAACRRSRRGWRWRCWSSSARSSAPATPSGWAVMKRSSGGWPSNCLTSCDSVVSHRELN